MLNLSMQALSAKVWRDPRFFVAFGFGSGLMPWAPGTWGTLMALPLYAILVQGGWGIYLFVMVMAGLMGIVVCDYVSQALGAHDYSGIVWDEIVGYLFTMFLAPSGWLWMVIGFLLFRLFDIWKPQPIRWIDQRVQGGMGIMLDDVMAAIPAWCLLQVLAWWWVR